MPTYPFQWVDAFTRERFGGNPCAVLFEADDLDEAAMGQIAREMNLSETAFVRRPVSSEAAFAARYFTPAEEIPMAGHPTIATIFALVESGRLPLTGPITKIGLELKAGVIPIEIYSENGQVERIVMTQNKPAFLTTFDPDEVMPVFGLSAQDARPGVPIQVVSTGTPQLMVAVKSQEVLRRIKIDHTAYAALRAKGNFFSPHLFALGGATPAGQTFARHFGTPPDAGEDPFTGSATGGMAAFLYHYGLIEQPTFVAEQGHWMGRPGQATVEVLGPREDIAGVKVGGPAITVLRGELEF